MGYRPGDFYRICERTGFKVYASDTRKEWTGRIVRRESYERRHPQDFVRGVTDRQIVPDPRPEPSVDNFIGPLTTTLTVAAPAGSLNLVVDDTTRMFATDRITVLLDNGYLLRTTIASVPDRNHLNIVNRLPWSAAIGNMVQDLTALSPADLGPGG
jgi:hypothetical protein